MIRIFITANRSFAIHKSRERLVRNLLEEGYEVFILTSDDLYLSLLKDAGAQIILVPFIYSRFSVFSDVKNFIISCRHVILIRPKLILNFHLKPIIFFSLPALIIKCSVINVYTGLGFLFGRQSHSMKYVGLILRFVNKISSFSIFQNFDDRQLFLNHAFVDSDKSIVISGSGVEINKFSLSRPVEKKGIIIVSTVMRLLKSKGVFDFINLSKYFASSHPNILFLMAGEAAHQHPDSIDYSVFDSLELPNFKFLGYVSDIPSLLNKSDIFVFPSVYREGVPRVILEASASSLPSLAYNVPGVKDAVIDKVTGFLVDPLDVESLSARLKILIEAPQLRTQMGAAAFDFVKANFDVDIISDKYFQIIRGFLK